MSAVFGMIVFICFFKQKTAYEMRISDWSADVCSSDLKQSGVRLMGFGHRVYKNFDPRATIIREHCHKVLKHLGKENDPLLELALKLEEIALSDDYFKSRSLYPNEIGRASCRERVCQYV